MEYIFSQILQMSFQASIVILCVLFVRMLFQKANIPERFVCILWLLPMIRMICPISVTSKVSIVPQMNTGNVIPMQSTVQNISQNMTILGNDMTLQGTSELISSNVTGSGVAEKIISPMQILSIVWLIGIVLLLCYSFVSIVRLKMKLQESIIVKDFSGKNKIYESDKIETPFVYGFFSPKIYLPSSIWESNYEYVIAHEEAHISRKDHLMKYICFVITMIHWFNPLAWLMFICLGKDIEMACDEHVVKRIGVENRTEYAETLLALSSNERKQLGIPLAFGEGETKGRIVHILKYKNTKRILIIVAIFIIGVVAVVTLTNAEKQVNEAELCETFLRDLFEISEEEYAEYEELEETKSIHAQGIWQRRYEKYFDENGYEIAVRNRVLGYGIKTRQAEFEIKNLEVEEKTSSSAEWYTYKVTVGDDLNEVIYSGEIFYSEIEKGKIAKITPYETEQRYSLDNQQEILFQNDELKFTKQEDIINGEKRINYTIDYMLEGIEFTPQVEERIQNLEEAKDQTVILSDGEELPIQSATGNYKSYVGIFASHEEMEMLLDTALVKNIKLQYPDNGNNFYFRYNDFGGGNISSAIIIKDNIKIHSAISFYEGINAGVMFSWPLREGVEFMYEQYTTGNGKLVYMFVDSLGESGILLLKEDNLLYEWTYIASENTLDMNWIRAFAEELQ